MATKVFPLHKGINIRQNREGQIMKLVLRYLQVLMLLLQSFKDDGDELNVAVPDLIRDLVC